MFKNLVLCAGHSPISQGAVYKDNHENDQTIILVDKIYNLLKDKFAENKIGLFKVPHNLGLKESIYWVNGSFPDRDSDLVIEIHRDSIQDAEKKLALGELNLRFGIYYNKNIFNNKEIASKLIGLFIKNGSTLTSWIRDQSEAGGLGWLNQVYAFPLLVEMGFVHSDNSDEYFNNISKITADSISSLLDLKNSDVANKLQVIISELNNIAISLASIMQEVK